jgi:hypothetical protein
LGEGEAAESAGGRAFRAMLAAPAGMDHIGTGPARLVVPDVWKRIWQEPLERAFVADVEVYGMQAANRGDAVADVWTNIKII